MCTHDLVDRYARYPLQEDKCDDVVVDVGKREQICLNETTISHKSRITRIAETSPAQ